MKNKLEYILLSILLGLSVLLGLSFWLNTVFNFNIFCATHWDEFAKLQATQTPINIGFYISFGIAIFIFAAGIYFIHRSAFKPKSTQDEKETSFAIQPPKEQNTFVPETEPIKPVVSIERPPRLNLPTNMAQIANQRYTATDKQQDLHKDTPSENPYNSIISDIFSGNGYVIKPNPTISGFVPNLFAIGNNEVIWIGGVDCDIDKMMTAIQKLDSVFKETLEDIKININAFVLDTLNKYDSLNTNLLIFKSIEDLKVFVNEHPADAIKETEQESFDSYSEYIDTIIKYIKNI